MTINVGEATTGQLKPPSKVVGIAGPSLVVNGPVQTHGIAT